MAKFFKQLDQEIRKFIKGQHVFFVATSPRSGRINLSPKGMDTFCCINDQEVAYLDLTGSGNETAAHLRDDGRITVMFCSFDKQPNILRLYGIGRAVQPNDREWAEYSKYFTDRPGTRQIIVISIESVQTSCGFSIPYMEYRGDRPTLDEWATKKGSEGLQQYRDEKNQTSIDGLPTGLRSKQ